MDNEFKVTFLSKKKTVISMEYLVDASDRKQAVNDAEGFLRNDGCNRSDFKANAQVRKVA